MHARVNTARVEPDQIVDLVAAAQAYLPHAKPQSPGLMSAMVRGDRRTGKIVIFSHWEGEAAGDAAEPMYHEAMRELGRFLAEPPTRERYEVLLEV